MPGTVPFWDSCIVQGQLLGIHQVYNDHCQGASLTCSGMLSTVMGRHTTGTTPSLEGLDYWIGGSAISQETGK